MRVKRKKIIFITLLLLTLVLIAGCGQEGKRIGEITVIDVAGREVLLNLPVEKVVLQGTGSGGAFLTLAALEGRDVYKRIAGWDPGLKNNRHWEWEKYSEAIPELEDIPDVGAIYTETFSLEKVISLQPDVVILTLNQYESDEDIVNQLESIGIPTIIIDYHAQTLENHTSSIKLLGKITGKEKRAQEIIDFYQEQVGIVYSRLESIDKPKPKVYVELGSEGPSTFGNTYGNRMWGALVKACGGINIAEGVIETWGPVNPEFVLAQNPDVIIIAGSYWPERPEHVRLGYFADPEETREIVERYKERPGWDNLNAVKNNRLHAVHHILSRDVHDSAATQFFAKMLYPDEFQDIDPEENLKEFHKRFLPIEYSGVFMMSLD